MQISNYGEFKEAVDLYFMKEMGEKQELLSEIQNVLENKDKDRDIWEWFMIDMLKNHYYIKALSIGKQTEALQELVRKIHKDGEFAYQIHKILYYASDKAINNALHDVPKWKLMLIKKEVQNSIKWIGKRWGIDKEKTTFISRVREKKRWKSIYRQIIRLFKETVI